MSLLEILRRRMHKTNMSLVYGSKKEVGQNQYHSSTSNSSRTQVQRTEMHNIYEALFFKAFESALWCYVTYVVETTSGYLVGRNWPIYTPFKQVKQIS